MTRLTTSAILTTALFAGTLAFAQTTSANPSATKADPYQSDPANGGTKPTPANEGNKVVVPAPSNAAADTKQEAAVTHLLNVDAAEMQKNRIHSEPPIYPQKAAQDHITGTVTLSVHIGKDGKVVSAEAISGPDMIKLAAAACVKHWRYKPYLLNGEPIDVETTVDIHFVLPR